MEQNRIKVWLKVNFFPSTYCSDGALHQKQWFECDPGSWRCHRCNSGLYTTGLFEKKLEYYHVKKEKTNGKL